jgi:hypothetical protein
MTIVYRIGCAWSVDHNDTHPRMNGVRGRRNSATMDGGSADEELGDRVGGSKIGSLPSTTTVAATIRLRCLTQSDSAGGSRGRAIYRCRWRSTETVEDRGRRRGRMAAMRHTIAYIVTMCRALARAWQAGSGVHNPGSSKPGAAQRLYLVLALLPCPSRVH